LEPGGIGGGDAKRARVPHYFETVVVSEGGTFRARIQSLPLAPSVGVFRNVLNAANLEAVFRFGPDDLEAVFLDMVGGFEGPREEWDAFVREVTDSDIVTVERSPGIVTSLTTLAARAGGGLLVGGPAGALVGVVLSAPALVIIAVVKGTTKGAEAAAETVAEEFVEIWMRRILRLPKKPD